MQELSPLGCTPMYPATWGSGWDKQEVVSLKTEMKPTSVGHGAPCTLHQGMASKGGLGGYVFACGQCAHREGPIPSSRDGMILMRTSFSPLEPCHDS